ncbi:MAG: hypothetical protein N3G21_04220 [Candidatus Hydrogenedentes bacterium]|nr:hypothetical protein [Candidatus Hydrogenedentota bacterium]
MKIGIFYSYGAQFSEAVNFILQKYPNDNIIIFLPTDYPTENLPSDNRVKIVSLSWDGSHLTLKKGAYTFTKILRTLRKNKLDLLVVLFDSPRLVFLSMFSKAKSVYVYNVFSEFKPLQIKLTSTIITSIIKLIYGYTTFLYIRYYIKCFQINSKKSKQL